MNGYSKNKILSFFKNDLKILIVKNHLLPVFSATLIVHSALLYYRQYPQQKSKIVEQIHYPKSNHSKQS